jgi:DNA-binding transcriptional ArsR family regulator
MTEIVSSTAAPAPGDLRAEILRQVTQRGADKSICPSEVARAYGEGWQRLMSHVRNAARGLAREGQIEILRKGRPVDPEVMKGVIRLRLRSASST